MSRENRVTYETTTFWSLLKMVSLKTLVFNANTFIALIITIIFYHYFNDLENYEGIVKYFGSTVSTISSSLLGIVIAGLAILIALTQGKILSMLLQKNVLQKFLFPFWFLSLLWGISTLLCLGLYLTFYIQADYIFYLIVLEVFIFIYNIFATIQLMGHAIKLGLFLASLEDN